MAPPPIRVGLLGYGYAGRTIHAPLIAATEGLHLVAVGSRDTARVHADWGTGVAVAPPEAVLARDDLDLVVVATPNDTHHPLALAALRGGRHVLVDKPFALDVAQASELVHEARRAQRVLSVFHNRRLDSDFLAVQALLAEGALGRVTTARLHFDRFRPQVRDRWREGAGPGAGLWADLGPHLLDQALMLFGRPDTLALERRRQRDGARSDDGFSARLRWHTGAHAGLAVDLHASMLSAHPGPRFELHGTRGSAVIDGLDPQEDALKALLAQGGGAAAWAQALQRRDWGHDPRTMRTHLVGAHDAADAPPRPGERPLPAGRWPAFMAALRDALHGQAPPPVSALQALAVQRLIDLGVESDEAGRTCAVPVQT